VKVDRQENGAKQKSDFTYITGHSQLCAIGDFKVKTGVPTPTGLSGHETVLA
jgi:hypothetical protein